MTKIFISSNPVNLKATLSQFRRTGTVEAEFGSEVVEGTVVTLAHHGERALSPCPCLGPNYDGLELEAIGVSHFDLDTLGGVLRLMGKKTDNGMGMFWEMAALVDVLGVHKGSEIRDRLYSSTRYGGDGEDEIFTNLLFEREFSTAAVCLQAFWAWSEEHRLYPPKDGSVYECTEFFVEAMRVVEVILGWDESSKEFQSLIEGGRKWFEARSLLEETSFLGEVGGVILRKSSVFVNHLYVHDGVPSLAVVSLNMGTGAITASLADPIEGVDCCKLMQQLFGAKAGGHAGIAGTPRDEVFTMADAELCLHALALEIKVATTEIIPV